ncbi:MAG: RING finger protein [Oscillospiraceae bacterium]
MSNYNGTKCISCGEFFKDGDDIVVCPECGTPYHRECYLKEGKCINTVLHEKGESWKPEYESATDSEQSSAEPIKCIRCGAENPPQGLFCSKCGMPLTGNTNGERPFNMPGGNNNNSGFNQGFQDGFGMNGFNTVVFDKDSEVEGVKLDDYRRYVGKNPLSFLANFIRFGKNGGKVSLNLGALIFPELYFFYRKMPKLGVLLMAITIVLSIPGVIYMAQSGISGVTIISTSIDINGSSFSMIYNICSYLEMGLKFLAGLFGTYWYYRKARKDITDIHGKYDGKADEGQIKEMIAEKGGVSWIAVIVSVTVYFILTFALLMGLNYL